jgi:hypothetical protein
MNYLDRLDEWLDGNGEGPTIGDVLRERGVEIPDVTRLNEEQLSRALWRLIAALAGIGVILSYTDHLTDRQLYERIIGEVLADTGISPGEPGAFTCYDLVGDGGDDEGAAFLTYFATDEEREEWAADFPDATIPPRAPRPADRDRLLPTLESQVAALGAG